MWPLLVTVLTNVLAVHGQFTDFQTSSPDVEVEGLDVHSAVIPLAGRRGQKMCRLAQSATTGTIESPNHPDTYPNHADCLYYIKTPHGALRLHFNHFDVESNENCTEDYVQVYNFRTWSPKLCGSSPPEDMYSPDGDMYVFFFSDGYSESVKGWNATFSTIRMTDADSEHS